MTWSLSELRVVLDGEVAGNQVLCPGPGHSRRDRSLSVRPSATARDGFTLYSHSGDDWRACRDYVAGKLGLPGFEPDVRVADDPVARMQRRARIAQAEAEDAAEQARRIALAVDVWSAALDPRDTLVTTYLASRGLTLPDDVAGETIRFAPAGRWRDGDVARRSPMMIAAMTDVLTGELRAVHRTMLTDDGTKITRKMLGIAAGTAIRLHGAAEPIKRLVVGEGIETCLSARQLGFGRAVWAMGSVTGIAVLPILAGVGHLALLEERDENGKSPRAVSDCGHRWTRAGRAVSVILPTTGKDLNDSLRGIE